MVRLRRRGSARGLRGKLTSDPGIKVTAAAVVLGIDPRFVLDTPEVDLPIVEAVISVAQNMRRDYDESWARTIANMTAHEVVPPLGKHITRLVRALRG